MDKIEILSIDFYCSICGAENRSDFHCLFLMQCFSLQFFHDIMLTITTYSFSNQTFKSSMNLKLN